MRRKVAGDARGYGFGRHAEPGRVGQVDVIIVKLEDGEALVPVLLDVPGDLAEFGVVVAVLVERVFFPWLEEFGAHSAGDRERERDGLGVVDIDGVVS